MPQVCVYAGDIQELRQSMALIFPITEQINKATYTKTCRGRGRGSEFSLFPHLSIKPTGASFPFPYTYKTAGANFPFS